MINRGAQRTMLDNRLLEDKDIKVQNKLGIEKAHEDFHKWILFASTQNWKATVVCLFVCVSPHIFKC